MELRFYEFCWAWLAFSIGLWKVFMVSLVVLKGNMHVKNYHILKGGEKGNRGEGIREDVMVWFCRNMESV